MGSLFSRRKTVESSKTKRPADAQTPIDVELVTPSSRDAILQYPPPPLQSKALKTRSIDESTTSNLRTKAESRDAWIWIILFASFGYLYAFGVYQDFYVRIYLIGHSPSSIGWMGSLQTALPFTMGVLSGKVYDMGHGRKTITAGSILFLFSLFMLSLAKEGKFYQIFLSQGLGMGIGVGLIFTPCTAAVSVQYRNSPNRVLAVGTALSGSSFGALIFPIMINQLLPRLGFASTVRATAYLAGGLLVVGNACIRIVKREPSPPPDIKSFFKEPPYLFYLIGASIGFIGCYFPVFYMQLYVVERGINPNFAFYSVSLINGLGIPARVLVALFAQKFGLWNSSTFMIALVAIACWAILGLDSTGPLVFVCIIYGIALGAALSLNVTLAANLAKHPQEVGARLGIALAIISPFLLSSSPAQGALLTPEFHWNRPIIFSAVMTSVSAGFFFLGVLHVAKERGTWIV